METYFYSCFIQYVFVIEMCILKINSAIPHDAIFANWILILPLNWIFQLLL